MNDYKLPKGLYGITAEQFSLGRSNIEVVQEMIKGGIGIIQYREKRHKKDYCEIFKECQEIRKITKECGVTFLINDFVDIALLVDADGVHVGQEDLPVPAVRELLGPDKIIGLSTHSPEQCRDAAKIGADYIGVGPIYSTQTKEDVCNAVGFEYLDYAAAHSTLPFVAIGGIKKHNIAEVSRHGAQSICLVTEIVGAKDINAIIRELTQTMQI
ncbi:thiamine phosphate synthase [Desulfogranum japonicum]|uniref:thiamine phosphate synthase n=1 Tax=Desulfogranum japonicum TaxID=231447 RepID=UPI000413D282|nr:thiamine phosphate synthase [Desulfogranum japonicum]